MLDKGVAKSDIDAGISSFESFAKYVQHARSSMIGKNKVQSNALKTFCGTWNVNAKYADERLDPWLVPDRSRMQDIYVIGTHMRTHAHTHMHAHTHAHKKVCKKSSPSTPSTPSGQTEPHIYGKSVC
jgi:hypothetical protein